MEDNKITNKMVTTSMSNTSINVEKEEKRQKVLNIIQKVITYSFLTLMGIVIIIPFYWMITSAFKSYDEVTSLTPTLFPTEFVWSNFTHVLSSADLGRYLFNTIFVGVVSTCLTLTTTVLGAFAFSRLSFKGKNLLFGCLLATMMIPGEMFVITNYITVTSVFGWSDTYQALIVPFVVSVFYIFLLRQTFQQIPNELYYAAKVDGTSDLKYLFKVMIPMAKATMITILILDLMGAWNSYIWPNLVQNNDNMKLISNWMRTAFNDPGEAGRPQLQYQMMASFVVTLPLFFVFIFCRKFIMQGVSRSGIKG